jgi:hypothetical protein
MIDELLNAYPLTFYVLGVYIIIDGFGSILVYKKQPFFFDHFVRVFRMIVGGLVIYFGRLCGGS